MAFSFDSNEYSRVRLSSSFFGQPSPTKQFWSKDFLAYAPEQPKHPISKTNTSVAFSVEGFAPPLVG